MSKPGANGRVSYNTFSHSRHYSRVDREEKVGHELKIIINDLECAIEAIACYYSLKIHWFACGPHSDILF